MILKTDLKNIIQENPFIPVKNYRGNSFTMKQAETKLMLLKGNYILKVDMAGDILRRDYLDRLTTWDVSNLRLLYVTWDVSNLRLLYVTWDVSNLRLLYVPSRIYNYALTSLQIREIYNNGAVNFQ